MRQAETGKEARRNVGALPDDGQWIINERGIPMKHGIYVSAQYHITSRCQGYKGVVRCWENGRLLWQEESEVFRYTEEDAISDGQHMRSNLISINNEPRVEVVPGWTTEEILAREG